MKYSIFVVKQILFYFDWNNPFFSSNRFCALEFFSLHIFTIEFALKILPITKSALKFFNQPSLFFKNFQFLAHTWYPSRCYEATGQKPELTGIIKLGFMNKYEDGREDCLASCRIYGMTACEWDVDDGECWAHTKEVVFGETSRVTFCYRFNQDKPVAGK